MNWVNDSHEVWGKVLIKKEIAPTPMNTLWLVSAVDRAGWIRELRAVAVFFPGGSSPSR